MGLGLVISLVGGTGIFAPFTDKAQSGPNSVTSGERPRAADLKLAMPVDLLPCAAGDYSDNTTTAVLTATDAQPGFQQAHFFCLKNAGSLALTVTVKPVDVVNVDTACTGDEEAAGDTTCGGDKAGELGSALFVRTALFPCAGGAGTSVFGGTIDEQPVMALGTLAPDEVVCGSIEVNYPRNLT